MQRSPRVFPIADITVQIASQFLDMFVGRQPTREVTFRRFYACGRKGRSWQPKELLSSVTFSPLVLSGFPAELLSPQ